MCKVERQRAKDGGLKGEEGKDKAKEKWGVCIRGLEAGSGCYECETRGGNLAAIGAVITNYSSRSDGCYGTAQPDARAHYMQRC